MDDLFRFYKGSNIKWKISYELRVEVVSNPFTSLPRWLAVQTFCSFLLCLNQVIKIFPVGGCHLNPCRYRCDCRCYFSFTTFTRFGLHSFASSIWRCWWIFRWLRVSARRGRLMGWDRGIIRRGFLLFFGELGHSLFLVDLNVFGCVVFHLHAWYLLDLSLRLCRLFLTFHFR